MVAQPAVASSADVDRLQEIPDEIAKGFQSWEDVKQYFQSEQIEISTGLEITDGFVLLEEGDKSKFVRQPLMILDWRFFDGEFGEAVTFRFMTPDGQKYRGNDGSTGIKDQLKQITATRIKEGHKSPQQGCAVRKGFEESVYYVHKDDRHIIGRGEAVPENMKVKASTFYLKF